MKPGRNRITCHVFRFFCGAGSHQLQSRPAWSTRLVHPGSTLAKRSMWTPDLETCRIWVVVCPKSALYDRGLMYSGFHYAPQLASQSTHLQTVLSRVGEIDPEPLRRTPEAYCWVGSVAENLELGLALWQLLCWCTLLDENNEQLPRRHATNEPLQIRPPGCQGHASLLEALADSFRCKLSNCPSSKRKREISILLRSSATKLRRQPTNLRLEMYRVLGSPPFFLMIEVPKHKGSQQLGLG